MNDEMKIINKNFRIIAKSNNGLFLISDKPNFDWAKDLYEDVYFVNLDGKVLYCMPFNCFFREKNDWVKTDEPLENLIKRKEQDLVKDCLMGFAVGDAFGVPVEFMSREQVRKVNLNDMIGCDTPNMFKSRWGSLIPAGSYSDDTAMLISSMDSISKNNGEINYDDLMKRFVKWWSKGEYSSLDFPFGLGGIVMKSLNRYLKGVEPLECGGKDYMDNGNGSLMRILPFSLYCIMNELNEKETCEIISNASSLTHANDISKMSCFIFTEMLRGIVSYKNASLALGRIQYIDYSKYFSKEAIDAHRKLLRGSFAYLSDDKINESGYVVDTLESAIYSIEKTKDYESAIKMAVNLGYDTDTVAGVTGALAGALYGMENIPDRWISKLRRKDYLEDIADDFTNTMKKISKENISDDKKVKNSLS